MMNVGDTVMFKYQHDDDDLELPYAPAINDNIIAHDMGIIKEINNTHALVEWQRLNVKYPSNRVKHKLRNLVSFKDGMQHVGRAFRKEKNNNYKFKEGDVLSKGFDVLYVMFTMHNPVYDCAEYLVVNGKGRYLTTIYDKTPDLKKIGNVPTGKRSI